MAVLAAVRACYFREKDGTMSSLEISSAADVAGAAAGRATVAGSMIPASATSKATPRALYALFFVSGIPALLYQIVWQRSLFAIYGVNVQSVTIVVTAFMLGLGLGSLGGG